jgi:NAD(P)-dependent dehydrogenase (short-subunit alcohol dehydrogenase family)
MKDFAGRTAVVTGGGSGMGRELVRRLVAEACNVAMCDVSAEALAETQRFCESAGVLQGLRITAHVADVSDPAQVERFRDEVAERHATERIHLLFNNAGIGGGGSMIAHGREEWERTFNVCWGGVYNCTRAFLPMLLKADERRCSQSRRRTRTPFSRGGADQRGGGGENHPRRRQGRALAHPRRRGCPSARRSGPPRAGTGLRRRVLRKLRG